MTYWTNHSLPVVVVLYDPATQQCHWQMVTTATMEQTSGGGWRILVPTTHVLNRDAADAWRAAAEGDPHELRIRELRLALPWIRMLSTGTRLVVDFADWINKSAGRGSISVGVDREDGTDPEELVTWHLLVGPANYAQDVPKLFAWADLTVHEETYDNAEHDLYENECSIWDEGDQFFIESYEDWRRPYVAAGARPYANSQGEVDLYRLEMTLNELGKAFLLVDDFATRGQRQLTL